MVLLIFVGTLLITRGSGKFTLTGARVDASYSCPTPSDNYSVTTHGQIDASNQTGKVVSIRSVSMLITRVAVHGMKETVGQQTTVQGIPVTPGSVAARSKTTLGLTLTGWWCTDPAHSGTQDAYSDYSIVFRVVTSAGTFKIKSRNLFRFLNP